MQFEQFLQEFIPQLARKSKQVNQACWILETTGSADAADLKAELDAELRFLCHDRKIYEQLLAWDQKPWDPILKRELNVLIRAFKQNQIPKKQLAAIAQKEAALGQYYAAFRPEFDGKTLSENDIRELLKTETCPMRRKKVWQASKEIGALLAPRILELVRLRNEAAQTLGYSDYFQMQLDLQEVDPKWLLNSLDELARKSDAAYSETIAQIERLQRERFGANEVGPWSWTDPFCQEDPIDTQELDQLVTGIDLPAAAATFYQRMGVDVGPILSRSDMYERPLKNQHAFCIHIDREGDVRTLNNVKPSIKWLETVLHELGHAIYELGFESGLPWLLKEPPHMITTEAMALIAGRQAYRSDSLAQLVGPQKKELRQKAEKSLRRRQLIFSRWVLVMTAFESELYRNPSRDLNRFWWDCVAKYQKMTPPHGREVHFDWAAKYHIGLAPVYYFSYLLGEMFASAIEETLVKQTGEAALATEKAGLFLNKKLFGPGNRMNWSALVEHVTGAPLTPDAWVKQFAT